MLKTEDSESSAVKFKEFLSQYLYSPLKVTTVVPNQDTTVSSIVKTREKNTRTTVTLKVRSATPYCKTKNNFQTKEIQNSDPQSSLVTLDTELGVLSVPDIIDFNLK
ncbi:2809_t:CDS:1, partial [Racocetra persica]